MLLFSRVCCAGITTIQKTEKEQNSQVDEITTTKKGITLGLAVNAIGNSVPPIIVFPRKIYKVINNKNIHFRYQRYTNN